MFPLYRLVEFFHSLKKHSPFRDSTPCGFLAKWRPRNKRSYSKLILQLIGWNKLSTNQKHYSDLGIFPQTSFCGEISGRVAKCRLFSQAIFFSKAISTILRTSTIFIALFTNAGSHGCSFFRIICFINSVINLPARPVSQTNKLEVYYWRSSKVWSHSFCSLLLFTWH